MKRFGRGSMAGGVVVVLLGVAAPARAQAGVVAVEQENFRAAPGGTILAELFEGTRLSRGERRGQWREATLDAWIWGRSVHAQQRPVLDLLVNAEGENLRAGPNGDRLGRVLGGMRLQRLETEGDWSRVRVEGWIFGAALSDSATAAAGVLTALHPDSLLARPEKYRGRVVEWTVQFIALQNAERFRTDFLEGEPFLLSRGPDDHPGFVYVAVPEELLPRVERLAPLQTLRILGRIRTARSSLTGAPVLDLLEIRGR